MTTSIAAALEVAASKKGVKLIADKPKAERKPRAPRTKRESATTHDKRITREIKGLISYLNKH